MENSNYHLELSSSRNACEIVLLRWYFSCLIRIIIYWVTLSSKQRYIYSINGAFSIFYFLKCIANIDSFITKDEIVGDLWINKRLFVSQFSLKNVEWIRELPTAMCRVTSRHKNRYCACVETHSMSYWKFELKTSGKSHPHMSNGALKMGYYIIV